eukprot:SAG25_NODE_3019_length_1266_cov_1.215081_1_plen_422_part_11
MLQWLLAVPVDVDDAEAAAEAFAPTAEQIERWAGGEVLAVLAELTEAVDDHPELQRKLLMAALAKLLRGLRLPPTLALDMAAAMMQFEPAVLLLPCLKDPSQLPSVLNDWADSNSFDAALSDLSRAVQRMLRPLAEEHLSGLRKRKLRKAVLKVIDAFDFTREHLDLLVAGDLSGLLKLVMVDAAAGAVDALTGGLQKKVDKAMDTAMKVEQAVGMVAGAADALGSTISDDVMEMLGELGTLGSLAKTLYAAAKGAKVHQEECRAFVKKVKRAERLTLKAKGVETIEESVREVEEIIQKAVDFIEKSQKRGFFLGALKHKSDGRVLERLGKELDGALAELNTDAVLSLAQSGCSQEHMEAAATEDESALETLRERIQSSEPDAADVAMETLAAGLPFDPTFLQDEIGDHMDELKKSLDELKK